MMISFFLTPLSNFVRKTETRKNHEYETVESKKNYLVDIAALLPVALIIFTGIVLLQYHSGLPDTGLVMEQTGFFWRNVHAIIGLVTLAIIGLHLYLHLDWFKTIFTKSKHHKYRKRNLTLVILFLAVTITGLIPWLFMGDSASAKLMLGIHNKFGLLMIVFVLIHLFSYMKWLINMTKKWFRK